MAVTYLGNNSALSNSAFVNHGTTGDLMVVLATRASGGFPTVPSGWNSIPTTGGTNSVAGWRIRQSGDTDTGTWTNADAVVVVVFSGQDTTVAPLDYSGSVMTSGTGTISSANPGNGYETSLKVFIAQNTTGALATSDSGGTWTVRSNNSPYIATTTSAYGARSVSFSGAPVAGGVTIAVREPVGSFPVVVDQDTTSGTVTSNSNSWTLTYPTNIASGDLLVAVIAMDGNLSGSGTGTWPADWIQSGGYSSANGMMFAKKLGVGTESGTFTYTTPGSANEQGAWMIVRIPAGTWEGTIGTAFANSASFSVAGAAVQPGTASGVSTTPDPPSLDPAAWDAEDTLWLAFSSSDTSRTYSAYPSTFTNTGYLASGGANGATLAWARLESAAASVDPDTFTHSASDDWVTATIAVRPAPPPVANPPTEDPRRRQYRHLLSM